jgi:hypothetical protein
MESVKVVPCAASRRIVFGIVSRSSSLSDWSSVRIKMMLGGSGPAAWAVSGLPGSAGPAVPKHAAANSAAQVSAILW